MSNQISLLFYYMIFFCSAGIAAWIAKTDARDNRSYLVEVNNGVLRVRGGQLIKWLLLVMIPVIAAALRYGIGTDYASYYILYEKISHSNIAGFATITQSTEFVSNMLYKVAYWVFNDFQGWLFLTSLITFLIGFVAIYGYKDSSSIFLMVFSFLILLYAPSYNIVRQIMAVSVVFVGLKYIPKRKPIHYFLIIFIATLLHTSAIFAAFFYFLNVKESKYAWIKQIIMFIACAAIPAVFSTVFGLFTSFAAFQNYGTIYSNQYGLLHVADIIFRLPIAIVILLFRGKLEKNDSDSRFYELLFFMEYISLLLTGYNKWLYRMMYFCIPGEVVLISRIPKCVSKNARGFVIAGIILYYVLFFCINNYYRGVDQIFPYLSIYG